MATINKYVYVLLMALFVVGMMSSCNPFDKINELKNSILGDDTEQVDEDDEYEVVSDADTNDADEPKADKIESNEQSPKQLFSEEEFEVLRQWIKSGNISAYEICVIGGKYYVFGNYQYEASSGRQQAYWNYFIKRLQNAGFIELVRYDSHGAPVYELQNRAYEYFEVE